MIVILDQLPHHLDDQLNMNVLVIKRMKAEIIFQEQIVKHSDP